MTSFIAATGEDGTEYIVPITSIRLFMTDSDSPGKTWMALKEGGPFTGLTIPRPVADVARALGAVQA